MQKLIIILVLFFLNCDSPQSKAEHWNHQLLCYSLGSCNDERGTRFGIIGDSWTDLIAGQPLIRTLRVQMEEDYGYRFTGATMGGQRLQNVKNEGIHFQVIENGGPDLKYMIISLGGNDVMNNFSEFIPDINGELGSRLYNLENGIIDLVNSGNSYKKNRWGGEDLVWFFHGYDYLNPDIPTLPNTFMCRLNLNLAGFTDAEVDSFHPVFIDRYNEMLHHAAALHHSIRIIDLRGTIGGPPFSSENLMFDCLHPDTTGFTPLTAAFVAKMQFWTGDEK